MPENADQNNSEYGHISRSNSTKALDVCGSPGYASDMEKFYVTPVIENIFCLDPKQYLGTRSRKQLQI